MEILPSIDLRNGQVVRLKQGDFARQTTYPADPLVTARSFAEAGAALMHLVDLDGAKAGYVAQLPLIKSLIESLHGVLPVQVGGGVRSSDDVSALLAAGAARVVIGTAALENWPWFEREVQTHPHQLVLAIDAKDGIIATKGWTASSNQSALDIARKVEGWPLAALLYTDIAVDGMLTGPNFPHTAALAKATPIPILASGGVGDLAHITALKPTQAWGVIVGRALYENKIDLKQALAEARR